jgi:hypothetical protein
MRIAFLCSGLEPGRDGVGDYCRRLGSELVGLGHDVSLIALNDRWHKDGCNRADGNVSVLRCGASVSLSRKVEIAGQALKHFSPDWLSLQYVCYGYHPKGLAWRWNSAFANLNRLCSHRHLSMHELWIEPPPLRHWAIGMGQRWIIRNLCSRFCPRIVTTSTSSYKRRLSSVGVTAEVVQLFGNIAKASRNDENVMNLLRKAGSEIVQRKRATFLNGVLFGAIHSDFDARPLIEWLKQIQIHTSKAVLLSIVGRNGSVRDRLIKTFTSNERHDFEVMLLGEQSAEVVSQVLQFANFGISTCSSEKIGKSGTFAAMREHGLPVVLADGELDPALQRSGPPVLQFKAASSGYAVINHTQPLYTELGLAHTTRELLRLWERAIA